ncbi:MAG: phosphoenolpyruvate synthase [Candidatus Buchananbacteria bacterium]
MPKSKKLLLWFKEVGIKDVPLVGGKNASLGEMYQHLTKKGVSIPNGFAITAEAYRYFIKYNKLDKKIKGILKGLKSHQVKDLQRKGLQVRQLLLAAELPPNLASEIKENYHKLCGAKNCAVAVRSSATAEDLPDASFAGQQETYLNVVGEEQVVEATKKCISSLFTNRAISYRHDKGFDDFKIALSVGVQMMVRSDLACSGVMFSADTESGFDDLIVINAAWGLGEYVVKGVVNPDEFFIYQKTLEQGFNPLIKKKIGSKEAKLVYAAGGGTVKKINSPTERQNFCLSNQEVLQLARWAVVIEQHYRRPMDMEFAKDGQTGKLFIVQARPETVNSVQDKNILTEYSIKRRGKILTTGISVGAKIGQGKVRVILDVKNLADFKAGEVLVTKITDPDWEPVMRIASAIITEQGGRTAHAAIVSRELGIPAVVGTGNATKKLKTGQAVTASCAEGESGFVYEGILPFTLTKHNLKKLKRPQTKVMMNIGNPDTAFADSFIPNDGVGLAREEFIINSYIKIHPLALLQFKKVKDPAVRKQIEILTAGYTNKAQFFVDKLAEGIAQIAAAFYPKDVIVRLSDFKSNEYANLIGGKYFEPKEENPMIGWRGASRYYSPQYEPAFALECKAFKKVREEFGLTNVKVMVPFCRTVAEGKKVVATMKKYGLQKGQKGLEIYVMVEIPSNVILAQEFAKIFDGFSIGSNDLTQLTLGVDRDSALVAHIYDERNAAVKALLTFVIGSAKETKTKIGICGQAPSDFPDFAQFLVRQKIDSISLNPDTVIKTTLKILQEERKRR